MTLPLNQHKRTRIDSRFIAAVFPDCNRVYQLRLDLECDTWFTESAVLHWANPQGGLNETSFHSGINFCSLFYGTLYNASDLQERLGLSSSVSNAEVLSSAYSTLGEETFKELNGDFSACIWDKQSKCLIAFSDVVGWKPLYYYWKNGTFAVSDSIPQICALLEVEPHLNKALLAEYICNCLSDSDETLVKDIYRVPPSHYVRLHTSSLQITRYWDLPRDLLFSANPSKHAEELKQILLEAVRARTQGESRAAISLSGGLDSSAIAAALRTAKPELQLDAFSYLFPGHPANEELYIQSVCEANSIKLNPILLETPKPKWLEDQIHTHWTFPNYPNGWLAEQARLQAVANDHRVILTGFGGDEILSGGQLGYAELLRQQQFKTMILQAVSDPRLFEALQKLVPYELLRSMQKCRDPKRWLPNWTTNNLLHETDLADRLRHTQHRFPEGLSLQQRVSHRMIFGGYACHLRELEAQRSTANGIAARHPFFDKALLEFCFRIPCTELYSRDQNKWILREALRDVLVENVRNRTDKATFNFLWPTFLQKFLRKEDLQKLQILETGWIDLTELQRSYDTCIRPDDTSSNLDSAMQLWNILAADKIISSQIFS